MNSFREGISKAAQRSQFAYHLKERILHLPERYELVAGTRAENVQLNYELVKVAVIGDSHCIILILNVPIKTASRYLVLHKITALPVRISDDKFAQYSLDFSYFALDNIRPSLWSEFLARDTEVPGSISGTARFF